MSLNWITKFSVHMHLCQFIFIIVLMTYNKSVVGVN